MDLLRLTDTIELVPPLDSDLVERLILVSFDHWSSVDGYIDTLPGGRSLKLRLDSGELSKAFGRRYDREDPVEAITLLLSTPRSLKHVVREVDDIWKDLKGEARLSDIIILTTLRYAAEPIVNFLFRNLDAARSKPEGDRAKTSRVRQEWEALLATRNDSRQIQALVNLLGISELRSPDSIVFDEGPQDASQYEPTDYIRRILAKKLASSAIRDQAVLIDIAAWRKGNAALIEGLVDNSATDRLYVDVWEHFAPSQHSADELFKLAGQVIRRLLERDGNDAQGDDSALIALWRRAHRAGLRNKALWLREQLAVSMPISMAFASDVFYYWSSPRYGVVESDERDQLAAFMRQRAQELMTDTASFRRYLSPDQPHGLLRLIARAGDRDEQLSFSNWEWLGPILFRAATEDPDLVLPEIASLIQTEESGYSAAKEGPTIYIHEFVIDDGRLQQMFGLLARPTVDLLANYAGSNRYVVRAREGAAAWLQSHS